MMKSLSFILLFSSFILSTIPFSLSEIKNTKILDDPRPMILFERFGYSKGGHVSVVVQNVTWKSRHSKSPLNLFSMGFFLVSDTSFPKILNESEHYCVLSNRNVKLLFQFHSLSADSTINGSADIEDPDEYNLVFGNCQPEFEISMHVHTEMYNLNDGRKDFLPAGQTVLPKLYFLFFLVYSCLTAVWLFISINQRPKVEKIHAIIGALLLVKTMKMICASEDKMFVRRTGTPHGWDVAFYIFGFLKGVMLFTVIILIGTGWSILKPYLQEREKKVLMTVIPLQLLENIVYVVISETGPATKDWMTWNQMFLLIDIVCCCAVVFPIIWSIRSLREASKTDGKAAKNLKKLTLFKQFYIVLVGYLYFTRILVPATGALINYRFEWLITVLAEGASLGFYLFIFCNFQPVERNPYLVIGDDEENEAGQILEEDDCFEL
ncbi:hypothetical protein SLE2022_053990 [Rubroshorea leprosula]